MKEMLKQWRRGRKEKETGPEEEKKDGLLLLVIIGLVFVLVDLVRLWWCVRPVEPYGLEMRVQNFMELGMFGTKVGIYLILSAVLLALVRESTDGRENQALLEKILGTVLVVLFTVGGIAADWAQDVKTCDQIPALEQGVLPVVEQLAQVDPDFSAQQPVEDGDWVRTERELLVASALRVYQSREEERYDTLYTEFIWEDLAAAYEAEELAWAQWDCDVQEVPGGWYWVEYFDTEVPMECLLFREGTTVVVLEYTGPQDLYAHAEAWREAIFPEN